MAERTHRASVDMNSFLASGDARDGVGARWRVPCRRERRVETQTEARSGGGGGGGGVCIVRLQTLHAPLVDGAESARRARTTRRRRRRRSFGRGRGDTDAPETDRAEEGRARGDAPGGRRNAAARPFRSRVGINRRCAFEIVGAPPLFEDRGEDALEHGARDEAFESSVIFDVVQHWEGVVFGEEEGVEKDLESFLGSKRDDGPASLIRPRRASPMRTAAVDGCGSCSREGTPLAMMSRSSRL